MTTIHVRRMLGVVVIGAISAPSAGAAAGAPPKVLSTGQFVVEFPGVEEIKAVEVRGLMSESGFAVSVRKPAPEPTRELKPVEVVIVRRAQEPDALWQWRVSIMSGRKDRRTGKVHILNSDHDPVLSFVILNAFPYKWVWPNLSALKPEPALEEIHLIAQAVLPANTPLPKSDAKTKTKTVRPAKRMPRMRLGP